MAENNMNVKDTEDGNDKNSTLKENTMSSITSQSVPSIINIIALE